MSGRYYALTVLTASVAFSCWYAWSEQNILLAITIIIMASMIIHFMFWDILVDLDEIDPNNKDNVIVIVEKEEVDK